MILTIATTREQGYNKGGTPLCSSGFELLAYSILARATLSLTVHVAFGFSICTA